jgi:hypothetical protein
MKFNQIHHNTPVIQKFNENSCMSMFAKLYIQIASFWPKLSRWIEGILLITSRPGPIIAASYLHFAQLQPKSTREIERKTWKKHSFSDGKCFTDFVLLRCFIFFSDHFGWHSSRNLELFLRFGNFLHAYLVIALQNIWSHCCAVLNFVLHILAVGDYYINSWHLIVFL